MPFLKLVTVFGVGTESVFLFCLVIFQQFATGFFEEGVQRGLMMNGLIRFNTETVKQRLFTCVITGAFFGLGHALNIVFGENPLVQVPFTFAWGMFIAAVYMLSDNILLVMLLHAFSDITFRIVKGLFGIDHEAGICRFVEHARTGFEIVILPLVAVLICVYYDNLKNRKSDAELR